MLKAHKETIEEITAEVKESCLHEKGKEEKFPKEGESERRTLVSAKRKKI